LAFALHQTYYSARRATPALDGSQTAAVARPFDLDSEAAFSLSMRSRTQRMTSTFIDEQLSSATRVIPSAGEEA
jgi:hypothetical protein